MALSLAPWSAEAAGLGRLTVLSALGEPLRAEIELTANSDEYASMAARLASADAFKNAGIEYAPTLAGIRFALERRPNGQAVISVRSERAVNDPFIDMLVEVNWASGRLVREYTFLLDPPELFRSPALAAAPEVKKEAPAPAPARAPETPPVAAPAGEKAAPAPTPEKAAPAPRPAAKPAEQPAAAKPAPAAETTRTVKKGDTLGKIASETRPDGVSLDQMLVALFRSNPDAFDGGNMNRLRAGKILGLPDKEAIAAVDAGEARKIVVAQSADFNAYRQKLATLAAAAPAREEAPRQAVGGKITPRVEEKTPAAPAGKDKLEVSRTEAAKGGKPGAQLPGRGVTEEDVIARDKALKDAKTRIAELEKNLGELRKLAEMRSAAGAKLQEQAEAKKAESPPVPKPAEAPKPAPAVTAEAPKPIEAPKPAEAPPAPKAAEAPPAPKPSVAPPPAPAPSEPPPSFIEENPDLVFGGAGILALLLGYFGYKGWRKRREAAGGPASVATVEPTASVFGTTGGQSVDTGTALPTDFSQDSTSSTLAADEGIDPVAEADVYMAYGRDRQAEEILLEALKTEPTRTAIHLKLLEIYAARKSLAQFEGVARELFGLTGGSGPDWEKAAALGRSLDPANPLYGAAAPAMAEQPAGPTAASEVAGMATMIMPAALAQQMAAEAPPEAEAQATAVEEPADEAPLSLDFDLDLGEEPAAAPPVAAEEPAVAEPSATEEPAAEEAMSLDFDLDLGAPTAGTAAAPAAETAEAEAGLDFDVSMPAAEEPASEAAPATQAAEAEGGGDAHALDFEFDLGEAEKPTPAEAPAEPLAGMPALDLSAISLELGETPATPSEAPAAEAPAEETLPEIEIPPIETPAIETPAIETPAIETPAVETPAAEEPAIEVPPAAEVPAAVLDDPEVATKLELAQAYEEMGDKEGARELLYEVLNEGSPAQQEAARVKLAQLG